MLKRVDNVEDRADRLLQQIAKSTERRDALLAEVAIVVERESNPRTGSIESILREIADVRDRSLPAYVDQSAQLAHTMNTCAALAQRSTDHHNRLSTLLERAQLAKRVAQSMMAMKDDVAAASEAMAAHDLEKAVALVKSYEDARSVVSSHAPTTTATTPDSPASLTSSTSATAVAAIDPAILKVRESAKASLEQALQEGISNNDKLGIMQATKLLAQLGCVHEAGVQYCAWVCDHTVVALKKMVERELAKMEDPTQAAMSYLVLVSQLLDTVAATFEGEEGFVKETFGNAGALRLISELHRRSTAQCVPVLAKFRATRQDALERLLAKDAEVQAMLDARQAPYASPAKIPMVTLPNGTRVLERRNEDDGNGHAYDYDDEDEDDEDDETREREDEADLAEENGQFTVQTLGGTGKGLAASPAAASLSSTTILDEAALSRSVADARQADQILEEMSHLVSCCDVYLAFAEEKQKTYRALIAKENSKTTSSTSAGAGGGVEKDTAAARDSEADMASGGRDTALLTAVEDMLSLYVPVQVSYFQSAFHHALQLQWTAVHKGLVDSVEGGAGLAGSPTTRKGASAAASPSPASPTSAASPTSFMAGLSSLYAAAAGGVADLGALNLPGGGGGGAHAREQALQALQRQQRAYRFYSDPASVTLAEDVFYFLRVAVHRAINTRSIQITSAVLMSAMDLIQTRLLPELRRHAGPRALRRHRRHGMGSGAATAATAFLPPAVLLRWTTVTEQSTEYTRRLAAELRRLSANHYKGHDLVRFQELAQDMDNTSRDVQNAEWKPWIALDARACYDGVMPMHLRRLNALSYASGLTEEVFYHYELNDPWVQACLVDWAALFEYVRPLLDSNSSDQLVHDVAAHLVHQLRRVWMQKRFNTLGALQLDKDVRALRDFFFGRVQEISLRTVFAPLSLMSTLLLSDSPRDAMEEAQNSALSADEKKAVLLLRQDFNKEEVMALRL